MATGFYDETERHFFINRATRMQAAIENVGHACRWLIDHRRRRGNVIILSDGEKGNWRYEGEHNALYEAVRSGKDYFRRRADYQAFYGDYVRYLDRIRSYASEYELTFSLEVLEYDTERGGAYFVNANKHSQV